MKIVQNTCETKWFSLDNALPPVSEKGVMKQFLVVDKYGDVDTAFYCCTGKWESIGYIVSKEDIVGWAEIPRPVLMKE